MNRTDQLVRPNVRALVPYSSARDEYKGKEGIFLDANESPFGPLNRYPDPRQRALRAAVANLKGVPEENIFLGNGSDEVIDLCYRIFCNPGTDRVVIFPPTYGMYRVSAAVNDVEVIRVPLDENFDIDIPAVTPLLDDNSIRLIFICSPNNPTGNSMDPGRIEFIIRNFRGVVVLDEAYSDFSDKPSFIEKIALFDNLIVMQTFSKAMGMAAARIGMAFASPDILQYFFRIKPPYNISTLNQEAALQRIGDIRPINVQTGTLIDERRRLAEKLVTIPVVEKVWPSDANFLLVKVRDADTVYDKLTGRNIIVRNRSREIAGCLRITAGTRSENNRLLDELSKINI
ncbi:MAG: histidinol-phosphate transaminase [Bacteroidales bacterium]|nr:histidinol-phosphate transaminase [Bacteroidales bacterium]MDT8373765.1 histidinol-phosphate transaminase [Bacteroidales bacterium]